MKKTITLLSFFLFVHALSFAQLVKQWDFRFGGSAIDEFHDIIKTSDGGYLVTGYSESGISGDKTQASQGSGDFWIVKIDNAGTKQWDKRYGGSNYDELFEAQQTSDGGYILGGWSNSPISGDKTQASVGAGDYWVIKIDAAGSKTWDKTFGGTFEDYLQSIKQTSDGGYILAGRSNSGISGDKTQANRGTVGVGWDYWVVKINSVGTKVWDQTYGGTDDDQLFVAQQTTDGGYIFGGYSASPVSGEKSQVNLGIEDYWIVKTDANGVKQWDKTFGGTNSDQLLSLIQTTDGGYLLGGSSLSGANGDKSQASRGNYDYWILKTNSIGVKQWDKRFGGTSSDNLFDMIETTDGGYFLGGASSSAAGGDKSQGNQGTVGTTYDYWAVKVSSTGIAESEKRFGGSSDDYVKSVFQNSDGTYVIGGWSTSGLSGDKTQASQGTYDYWIAKVSGANSVTTTSVAGPLCSGASITVNYTSTGLFNAGNVFTAQLSNDTGAFVVPIVNIGTVTATGSGSIGAIIPLSTTTSPNYAIRVISSNPVSQNIYPFEPLFINAATQYFLDADADGYGNPAVTTYSCTPIGGYVTNNFDCNDSDPLVHSLPIGTAGISFSSLNCEGTSGNLFYTPKVAQAESYLWFLSNGLSSTFINNETLDTVISITIALGNNNELIKVIAKNSCGTGDTSFLPLLVSQNPDSAGSITGDTLISSCINQLGKTYSIAPVAYATHYVWTLPANSFIAGNADTNIVVVNYSTYGASGTISVHGYNDCAVGATSYLNINYKPIPTVDICFITVDSASQKGVIWWQKPLQPQADSIVLLRKNLNTLLFDTIAVVDNVSPSSYLDTSSKTNFQAETYKIAVKDTCGNIGEFSNAVVHQTIYLRGLLGFAGAAKLYWNDYEGIDDTSRYYYLLRDDIGNGPFVIIDSVLTPQAYNYKSDPASANYPNARYVVELKYFSDCNANLRTLTSRSTTRSNIRNRVGLLQDPSDVGINPIMDFENNIKIYPNPAIDNITIEIAAGESNCAVSLLTLMGQTVAKKEISKSKYNSKTELSIKSLNKGIYILMIQNNEYRCYRKIKIN